MNPIPTDPRRSGPESGTRGATPELGELVALLRALQRAEDAAGMERLLCGIAIHPDGGGFGAATLLRRVPGLELVEVAHREQATAWCAPLAETLEGREAGRAGAAGWRAEPGSIAPAMAADDLAGAAAVAWSRSVPAIGPASSAGAPWRGHEAVGAVPLRCEGELRGLLVVERDGGVGEDARPRLELLAALAAEAWIALARRQEARRRGRHLAALGELARACVSTLNLAEVLRLATRLAASGSGARAAAMWNVGPGGALRLEALEGAPGWRERVSRAVEPLVRECLEAGSPRCVDCPLDEPALAPEIAAELGALVVAPIAAYGRPLGAVAVFLAAPVPPGGARDELSFLGALADLAALALDQARRFQANERLEQRTRDLTSQLRREERLAAAGELALRAAAEARNPLASIGAFARRMQRDPGAEAARREHLEIIVREAGRLERLLDEQASYAAPTAPELRLESLNDVVQEALSRAGETLVRRRVRLLKRLAPDLPALLLDPERVRRAVENVLEHVLEILPVGGRVRLESRLGPRHVTLEIAHDGPRAPGEALEQLFVPFASARPGGPEIGLGVAQRIVRQHGGEVRVRSEGEWSTIVTLTFPVRGNEDRRHHLEERRAGRRDRRGS